MTEELGWWGTLKKWLYSSDEKQKQTTNENQNQETKIDEVNKVDEKQNINNQCYIDDEKINAKLSEIIGKCVKNGIESGTFYGTSDVFDKNTANIISKFFIWYECMYAEDNISFCMNNNINEDEAIVNTRVNIEKECLRWFRDLNIDISGRDYSIKCAHIKTIAREMASSILEDITEFVRICSFNSYSNRKKVRDLLSKLIYHHVKIVERCNTTKIDTVNICNKQEEKSDINQEVVSKVNIEEKQEVERKDKQEIKSEIKSEINQGIKLLEENPEEKPEEKLEENNETKDNKNDSINTIKNYDEIQYKEMYGIIENCISRCIECIYKYDILCCDIDYEIKEIKIYLIKYVYLFIEYEISFYMSRSNSKDYAIIKAKESINRAFIDWVNNENSDIYEIKPRSDCAILKEFVDNITCQIIEDVFNFVNIFSSTYTEDRKIFFEHLDNVVVNTIRTLEKYKHLDDKNIINLQSQVIDKKIIKIMEHCVNRSIKIGIDVGINSGLGYFKSFKIANGVINYICKYIAEKISSFIDIDSDKNYVMEILNKNVNRNLEEFVPFVLSKKGYGKEPITRYMVDNYMIPNMSNEIVKHIIKIYNICLHYYNNRYNFYEYVVNLVDKILDKKD